MGIPVSGKNIFPSNIQGLPTWFQIRVSEDGFVGRRDTAEIVVAMNQNTLAEDIKRVAPGGVLITPTEFKVAEDRADITYYNLPVQQMAKDSGANAELRPYVANMVYVGALIELLGIDANEVKAALVSHFKGKTGPINLNYGVVEAAIAYTRENIVKRDDFRVQKSNKTAGKILIDGNEAGGLGAVFGGVTVAAWYPITPSTSLVDALGDYAKELRVNTETGEKTYAIVQAEDELAALGIVTGAGWMGARAMTSTSGPGISLMTEFAGFAYFADIPVVIWDIQRMGPSTGLPTRTSQGDVLKVYFLGHGDPKHVVLLPANMEECFESGWRAFDLAERLADAGLRPQRPRPRHEPVDERAIRLPRSADGSRQGAERRETERASRLRALWRRGRHGVGPRTLPGTDLRSRRISRAAAATTSRRSTPSAQTTGWRTCSGWSASTTTRARSSQRQFSTRRPAPRSASSPMARPTRRWRRRARCWRAGRQDELSAAARPADHRGLRALCREVSAHLCGREQLRRADGEDPHDRGAEARRQTHTHRAQ